MATRSNIIRKLRIKETLLIQNLQPQLNIDNSSNPSTYLIFSSVLRAVVIFVYRPKSQLETCLINLTSYATFFSCLYDVRILTVFEPGFTVFDHYILTATLLSPIAGSFYSTPLVLFYFNPNYSVYVVIIMPHSK